MTRRILVAFIIIFLVIYVLPCSSSVFNNIVSTGLICYWHPKLMAWNLGIYQCAWPLKFLLFVKTHYYTYICHWHIHSSLSILYFWSSLSSSTNKWTCVQIIKCRSSWIPLGFCYYLGSLWFLGNCRLMFYSEKLRVDLFNCSLMGLQIYMDRAILIYFP